MMLDRNADGNQTISSFKQFAQSIEAVYMVEASMDLTKQQAKRLSDTDEPAKSELGYAAPCKYIPNCTVNWCEDIRFVPKGNIPLCILHYIR